VAADGVAGKPWTAIEIETTIDAYLRMLLMQVAGERYTKAGFVRDLRMLMPARNARAIEAKFHNISAILIELGLDWIDGYKPFPHYQHALRGSVEQAVARSGQVREALEAYEGSALVAPSTRRRATEDVVAVVPNVDARGGSRSSVTITGSSVSALRDFRAHALGSAGERWVVDLERESLRRAGRDDLAARVEWSARDVGDGLGYDVTSYLPTGSERFIEVKTTNLGPRTPFYITRWEIDVSRERAAQYSIYRVHGFARDPRIYVINGSVEDHVRLEPKVFLGIPA
jgi:hypothetical protein